MLAVDVGVVLGMSKDSGSNDKTADSVDVKASPARTASSIRSSIVGLAPSTMNAPVARAYTWYQAQKNQSALAKAANDRKHERAHNAACQSCVNAGMWCDACAMITQNTPLEMDRRTKANKMIEAKTFSKEAFDNLVQTLNALGLHLADHKKLYETKLTLIAVMHKRSLSWQQAQVLYSNVKELEGIDQSKLWELEHVLCHRVYDKWNIERQVMPHGHCYHYKPWLPDDTDDFAEPSMTETATFAGVF